VLGTKIKANPIKKLANAKFLFFRVIMRMTLMTTTTSPISASKAEIPNMSLLLEFFGQAVGVLKRQCAGDKTVFQANWYSQFEFVCVIVWGSIASPT
jgi:hypothetical protein